MYKCSLQKVTKILYLRVCAYSIPKFQNFCYFSDYDYTSNKLNFIGVIVLSHEHRYIGQVRGGLRAIVGGESRPSQLEFRGRKL